MNTKTKQRTLRIVTVGMLSAVCFVLSRFVSVSAGSMKFTFAGLPILLASLLYGPVDGLLVGGIGEFLSQLFSYGITVTTPLWILPAMLRGIGVGLFAQATHYRPKTPAVCGAILISNLGVTLLNGLVIWADAVIMGYYSKAYVFGATGWRFLASFLTAVLYCVVLPPLMKALNRAGFGKGEKKPNA